MSPLPVTVITSVNIEELWAFSIDISVSLLLEWSFINDHLFHVLLFLFAVLMVWIICKEINQLQKRAEDMTSFSENYMALNFRR